MNDPKPEVPPPPAAAPSPWWFRALLVALGLAAWFWTQSLIGQRAISGQAIGDELQVLTAPAHQYLLDHPRAANGLLIASSAGIDLFALFLLGRAIFGPTFRPFIGLLMLFALRQICQALCALPPPEVISTHISRPFHHPAIAACTYSLRPAMANSRVYQSRERNKSRSPSRILRRTLR